MKTATVRDLRNRFPRVAAWIAEGEPVEITRAGKLFARLVPPAKTPKLVKPDIMARLKETWGDRIFSNRKWLKCARRNWKAKKDDCLSRYVVSVRFLPAADNSPAAAAHFKAMPEALHVSGLLLYEFRQSVRFQVWLDARDKTKGYPQADCDRALADLQTDLDTGAVVVVTADCRTFTGWPKPFPNATPYPADTGRLTCFMSPRRCTWARGNF